MKRHFTDQMERLINQLIRGEEVKPHPPLEGSEHVSFAFSRMTPDMPEGLDMLIITLFIDGGALVTQSVGTTKPIDAKRTSHIGALTDLLDFMGES